MIGWFGDSRPLCLWCSVGISTVFYVIQRLVSPISDCLIISRWPGFLPFNDVFVMILVSLILFVGVVLIYAAVWFVYNLCVTIVDTFVELVSGNMAGGRIKK